jgi:ubiquinone/menaquinone biosynthesis C-methylase UbiE
VTSGRLRNGRHPDSLESGPPDESAWPPRQRRAAASEAMVDYRAALALGSEMGIRESVLDDLSSYFGLPPEECVRRCRDWEQWSVLEWSARPRETSEDIRDFYVSTASWCFDLLWYAYLQAEGHAYPVSVATAAALPRPDPGDRHLDFGSGVGVTAQLFQRLGYETDLADVSTSLIRFARWRLERRGVLARYIDLNASQLASQAYDVITAIDTLVHVPDVAHSVGELHRALKPAGILFANFDVRPPTPENAWHLYSDDLPLRWALQRTGFEPIESLDGMITAYRKVEPSGVAHQLRGVRDLVALRSPLRPAYRYLRGEVGRLRENVESRR